MSLAKTHGFDCTVQELKQAARDLLAGGDAAGEAEGHPDRKEIDDAAAGMTDLQNDVGYSNDTGYAALYGVAGVILK